MIHTIILTLLMTWISFFLLAGYLEARNIDRNRKLSIWDFEGQLAADKAYEKSIKILTLAIGTLSIVLVVLFVIVLVAEL